MTRINKNSDLYQLSLDPLILLLEKGFRVTLTDKDIKGLSDEQVLLSRQKHGANIVLYRKQHPLQRIVIQLVKEPMVLLLLAAAAIYFFTGDTANGIFLAVAIIFVAAISLYEDSRSRNALEQLKSMSRPVCRAIRNGTIISVPAEEVVIGDVLVAEEGTLIAADAVIIHANDFSVNESLLTGEAMPVTKNQDTEDKNIYQGAMVVSGLALAEVTGVGSNTKLGKIGKSIEGIQEEKTPLEMQIRNFVLKMLVAGAAVFIAVWVINYNASHSVAGSMLKALTLAMSVLPEEIPVAFTSFMALGARRLMQSGIVVKQMKTVETLGSASVICVDKTGTITENRMSLAGLFLPGTGNIVYAQSGFDEAGKDLITAAMWASEPIAFDPMEVALHDAYEQLQVPDERTVYSLVHEYPLGGKMPMMTHVFEADHSKRIIAAKGAPEAIVAVSGLSVAEQKAVSDALEVFASKGYRVLGVAVCAFSGNDFPEKQTELSFVFKGLVAFYDPPKEGIRDVLKCFYDAGIDVKMLTGDNAMTAVSIAIEAGFRDVSMMSGETVMAMDDAALADAVKKTTIFSRVYPEAKLRIINTLKVAHEVVAMTGDGINDGPALKAAHIGIAMGKKGTETARQAASLILPDDDISKMITAIAMGRKIYANLKKAVRYIISIHIPIILIVFLPLLLGWEYPNIFTPVHVIFLELVMGPTCSLVYENEPAEPQAMLLPPRPFSSTFFNGRELLISVFQGLAITAALLFMYQYGVDAGMDEDSVRTMVFITLISANILLTLVNRSFYYSLTTTIKYRNPLMWQMIIIVVLLLLLIVIIPVFRHFFLLSSLTEGRIVLSVVTGCLSVLWFELFKYILRITSRQVRNI
ncbi:cation-translocating P-type ATPase [Chitinophagaceae bacterium MMS25-I14]